MLTLLHTSDWHLGRRLYNQPRYDEFTQFLDWLIEQIDAQPVDILLIAGDVFDTTTPSTTAQALYYQFLTKIAKTQCRHVVITAGNHDSPSFLTAPSGLLKALDIHVIGSIGEDIEHEILQLNGGDNTPEMLILAVPFLRDRDVRRASFSDSLDEKHAKHIHGIDAHYQAVTELALAKQAILQQQFNKKIPVIGSGHLFVTGGQTVDGDGVRELSVGGLTTVSSRIFHDSLDYVALGHLHVPQVVDSRANVRYSGSPIAMGFGEARQQKQVTLVQFTNDYFNQAEKKSAAKMPAAMTITPLPVPTFQRLATITGDWDSLASQITALKQQGESVWLEVVYDGETLMADFREQVVKLVANSTLVVLKYRDDARVSQALAAQHHAETLEDLDEKQVFERCLEQNHIVEEQRAVLWDCYLQVLEEIHEFV